MTVSGIYDYYWNRPRIERRLILFQDNEEKSEGDKGPGVVMSYETYHTKKKIFTSILNVYYCVYSQVKLLRNC